MIKIRYEQDRMIIKDLTAEINLILTIQEERAGEEQEVNKRDILREKLLQSKLSRMQQVLDRIEKQL